MHGLSHLNSLQLLPAKTIQILPQLLVISQCYDFGHNCSEINTFFGVEYCGKKTNRKGFSIVGTLIDNDIRHHSGQNVLDSQGVAE